MTQDTAQAIFVTEVTANTPVGLSIQQTAASIRAGISGFTEFSGYMPLVNDFDVGDESVQVAVHEFAENYDWGHLFDLLNGPLTQLIALSGLNRSEVARGGLFLSLPVPDEVVAEVAPPRDILEGMKERMALPAFKKIAGAQSGTTGVHNLVKRAIAEMQSGEISFCIIAAVDSYMLDGRLAFYDEGWRLKSKRNPSGFIPGEAAGVMLLETEAFAKQRDATLLLKIDDVQEGLESNTILGDKSSTGSGLAEVIRPIAEQFFVDRPCRWVFSDLNGERYKAYEWGVVLTRLHEFFANDHQLSLTADVIGEVGAATTIVQIGCVVEAIRRNYAKDDSALLIAGSDAGKRAAMMVSRVD